MRFSSDLLRYLQPEPQRSAVVLICQRTGLNVKFALDCLEMNQWNVDKAVADFDGVKV